MEPVKELKRKGRKTLKSHYFLMVILCLIAVIWSGEFADSGNMSSANSTTGSGGNVSAFLLDSNSGNVFSDIISNNLSSGEKSSGEALKSYKSGSYSTQVLGRRRGVLAQAVNNVTSGRLYVKIAGGIYSITQSGEAVAVIFTIVGLLFYIAIWIFTKKIYVVIMRRMFLEARVYERVPFQHILHLLSVRKWCRASISIFICAVFQFLWDLTIIGGFIKYFSYFAVPYILAENPGIKARDAITLSRKMMYGHKMECFKYHLSFIPWYILSLATLGAVGVLYFYPYKTATFTEYYSRIRSLAKENMIDNADLLDDPYLFTHADASLLDTAYADTIEDEKKLSSEAVQLAPFRKFMADFFGLWIGFTRTKRAYQKQQHLEYMIRNDRYELAGDTYPARLDPHFTGRRFQLFSSNEFLRCYTIWSLLLLFFLFSFLGWCWEVSLHLMNSGVFVNRGTMFGPWLPIYGCGGVIVLVLLSSLRKKPVAEFIGAIILCGFVEYGTSYYLQQKFHMRWWDYTGYFLNLDGRICAEGLLVFAIGGMVIVYLIAPTLDSLFSRLSPAKAIPLCLCLVILFSIDAVHSNKHPNTGKGITNYSAYKQTSASALLPDDQNGGYFLM